MNTDGMDVHAIANARRPNPIARFVHHRWRRVDGGHAIAVLRQVHRIRARAAAEIEDVRGRPGPGSDSLMCSARIAQRIGFSRIRAPVAGMNVERPLCLDERARHDAQGALLHDVFSEQTQRTQTGLAPTSNDSRNARRLRLTIVPSDACRMLPMEP